MGTIGEGWKGLPWPSSGRRAKGWGLQRWRLDAGIYKDYGTSIVRINVLCIIICLWTSGSQGMKCGGLNEKSLSWAEVFEHWSRAGDTVWECYRELLKEEHHWEWAWRIHGLTPLPFCSLSFLYEVEEVVSQLPDPGTCCHASPTWWTLPMEL